MARRRVAALLRFCLLQRSIAQDSCSAGLPSHLRRFPLKYETWLASAESIDPKRDRLVECHLSKNERRATYLLHLHEEGEEVLSLDIPFIELIDVRRGFEC